MGIADFDRPDPWSNGRFRKISNVLLNVFALCVIAMMVAIVFQVGASRWGVTTLISFEGSLPLLGHAVTLNSLSDLQWHLMAVVALGPVVLVWIADRHVRVDVAYSLFSSRARSLTEIAGHLLFTLPFLIMCIPASWTMMLQALERGEQSANGGLVDRFAVKAVVPISLTLLFVVVIVEFWPLVRRVLKADAR